MIHSIAHPTDFSPEGQAAFEHALALALANRCRLDLLHVHDPSTPEHWDRFPHVREVLQRWGRLPAGAAAEDIAAATGVAVRKVEIRDDAPGDGLTRFLRDHRPDLIVLASHGRAGISRWLNPSISTAIVRETVNSALILGPLGRPFVDSATGRIALGSVLVPVDHAPAPQLAVRRLETLLEGLGATMDVLHVGPDAPVLPGAVRSMDGPVIETLLDQASRAALVAMPMAPSRSLLDLVRGSTTDRMVRQATCPVLAVPAPE